MSKWIFFTTAFFIFCLLSEHRMPKCTKLVNYWVLSLLDTLTRRDLCSQSVAQLWRVFVCADLLQSLFQRTHCEHSGHKLSWKNITGTSMTCKPWFNHSYHHEISPNKMLSYRRETALHGTLVLAESGRLELRDNILLILWVCLQPLWHNRSAKLSNSVRNAK